MSATRAAQPVATVADFFDDPVKLEDMRRAWEAPAIWFAIALPFFLNALPLVLHRLVPQLASHGVAPALVVGAEPAPLLVWVLAVAQLPALWVTGRVLRLGDRHRFWRWFNLQSLLQAAWIQALAFSCLPFFPWLGLAMLCGVFFAGAFNDAMVLYDSPRLRAQYLAAILGFDLLLLAIDGLGGRGLVFVARVSPAVLVDFLAGQGVLLLLTQAIISLAGRNAREHDGALQVQARLQRETALLRRERSVVQRLTGFLTQGLAAGRFSHDVASPVTVINGCLEEFDSVVRGRGEGEPLPANKVARLKELVSQMKPANERLLEMTDILAESVRGESTPEQRPAAEVVGQAVRAMRDSLLGHAVQSAPPDVELETSALLVAEGQAEALGNIMTNGALQNPQQPLVVRGRLLNPWFYVIVVRDFGVAPHERPTALARVRQSLALGGDGPLPPHGALDGEGEGEAARGAYRGYGIGLMMAKVIFVRHDGWVDVLAPSEGPGLVLCAILPVVEGAARPSAAPSAAALVAELPAMPGV